MHWVTPTVAAVEHPDAAVPRIVVLIYPPVHAAGQSLATVDGLVVSRRVLGQHVSEVVESGDGHGLLSVGVP